MEFEVEEILKARPARRGGIYIPRRGEKSIIITNLSLSSLQQLLEGKGPKTTVVITKMYERPNVILAEADIIVEEEEEESKPIEFTAPSGIKIKTTVKKKYTIRRSLLTGKIIEKRFLAEEYEPVRVPLPTTDECDEIYDRKEIIASKIKELRKKKEAMEKERVLVHKKCGTIVREIDSWGRNPRITVCECPRCNVNFTVKKFYHKWETEEPGWLLPDKTVHVTVKEELDEDLEYRDKASVDSKHKKQLEELESQLEELESQLEELESQVRNCYSRIKEERKKIAENIAKKLGIKIVNETETKIFFNDGTVYYKGDMSTQPYFENTSRLFEAIENAWYIWLAAPRE